MGLLGFGLALGRWSKPLEVSRRRGAVEAVAFLLLLLLPSAMSAQELTLTGIAMGWVGVRLVALHAPGDLAFAAGAALGLGLRRFFAFAAPPGSRAEPTAPLG